MNRRDFLRLLGSTGMVAAAPFGLSSKSFAADDVNHFFVMVHAGGGWDPTSLCDPKGSAARSDGRGPVNNFTANQIGSVANSPLRFAPFPDPELATSNLRGDMALAGFDNFFNKHADVLRVINGVDTNTNSHDGGRRFIWSGIANDMRQPAFAALVASIYAPEKPLSFLSNGGYDNTASLVAPTRTGSTSSFKRLTYPNRYDVNNEESVYLNKRSMAYVDAAKAERNARLLQGATLPQRRQSVSQLFSVQMGGNNLDSLIGYLPENLSGGMKGQAEMAAAAFRSGLAVSANLVAGGFDTHGSHDRNQLFSLTQLMDGVDHLMDELGRQGLAEKTTVLVSSDFGRTPYYNGNNGKDHWKVTSMLAMGKGVVGNSVVGATDANFNALAVNKVTLQPDVNGVKITPEHIHRALRKMAGIETAANSRLYPLGGEDLDIFGA